MFDSILFKFLGQCLAFVLIFVYPNFHIYKFLKKYDELLIQFRIFFIVQINLLFLFFLFYNSTSPEPSFPVEEELTEEISRIYLIIYFFIFQVILSSINYSVGGIFELIRVDKIKYLNYKKDINDSYDFIIEKLDSLKSQIFMVLLPLLFSVGSIINLWFSAPLYLKIHDEILVALIFTISSSLIFFFYGKSFFMCEYLKYLARNNNLLENNETQ